MTAWWCKQWLSLIKESSSDKTFSGGHRAQLTDDTHEHCHHPYRLMSDEQPLQRGNARVMLAVRVVMGRDHRARDLDGSGRRGQGYVLGDRTVHGNQWLSTGGRAGAVDGLLHHRGTARLRGAWCWSSRKRLRVTGKSSSQTDKNSICRASPCILSLRADERRRPVRERLVPSSHK